MALTEQEETRIEPVLASGSSGLRRFPYAFAKRHGVIVDRIDADRAHLFCRPGLRLSSLGETRRLLGLPLACEEVSPDVFSNLLARAYQLSLIHI